MNYPGLSRPRLVMIFLILASLACYPRGTPLVHVAGLAWSPDGAAVAVYGALQEDQFGGAVKIFDTQTGKLLQSFLIHDTAQGWTPVASVAWSPDGTRLATTEHDHVIL